MEEQIPGIVSFWFGGMSVMLPNFHILFVCYLSILIPCYVHLAIELCMQIIQNLPDYYKFFF